MEKTNFVQVKVIMTVNASKKETFNAAIQSDLSDIFKKHGILPSVTGTDLKGTWTQAGLSRTIFFEDKTQVFETLTCVEPHSFFSYRVENFTSSLKYMVSKIEGNWTFTTTDNNQTKIEWNYNLFPKNKVSELFVNSIVKKSMKGYLTNALNTVKQNAENKIMSPEQFI